MTKWIKCSERLPKVDTHVITFEIDKARMPIKVNYLQTYQPIFAYGKTENITHWQPLPEPPENE